MTAFIDTSVWYAAADRGDQSNARAQELLEQLDDRITTDHVLAESWGLLSRRLGYEAAETFWERIRAGVATVATVESADLEAAWSMGEHFADQRFSLVDRTSFAVMVRLGVHEVASFDRAFAAFRFGRNRDRALTVHI